jgi:hypothetical protein
MQQDENFESLRRALKLKRHEVPPPGYFKNLSTQIVGRIRENDVHDRARVLDEAAWEAPWVNKIVRMFQRQPVFAGIAAAGACVLMIAGLIYSEQPPSPTVANTQTLGSGAPLLAGVGLAAFDTNATLASSSSNPVGALPAGTTLFDKLRPQAGYIPVFTTTNLLK